MTVRGLQHVRPTRLDDGVGIGLRNREIFTAVCGETTVRALAYGVEKRRTKIRPDGASRLVPLGDVADRLLLARAKLATASRAASEEDAANDETVETKPADEASAKSTRHRKSTTVSKRNEMNPTKTKPAETKPAVDATSDARTTPDGGQPQIARGSKGVRPATNETATPARR